MAKKSGACDTRCQLLFTEAINTENTRRLNWFRKNEQKLIDNLGNKTAVVSRAKARIAEQEEKRRKRLEAERIEVHNFTSKFNLKKHLLFHNSH